MALNDFRLELLLQQLLLLLSRSLREFDFLLWPLIDGIGCMRCMDSVILVGGVLKLLFDDKLVALFEREHSAAVDVMRVACDFMLPSRVILKLDIVGSLILDGGGGGGATGNTTVVCIPFIFSVDCNRQSSDDVGKSGSVDRQCVTTFLLLLLCDEFHAVADGDSGLVIPNAKRF